VAPRSLKVHGKNLPFGGVCSGGCNDVHAGVIGNALHEDRKPPE